MQSESNEPGTTSPPAEEVRPAQTAPSESTASELSLEVRTKLCEQDPEALGLFYDAYFDRLYGYIRRMVGEDQLAEDVTQDVFLHLHRSLPSYDPSRALRPWVFTIATNKVRDFWRSRRYRETLRETSYDEPEGDPYAESDERAPLAVLANSELGELMTEAIERLPEGMRTTFTLRYFEGLSFAAIGEVIQRNEAAVRKRYSRAMEELRIDLAKVLEITEEEGA
ncbi:MAG: RNA polymerase sigma factor [Planctomycetota bacterium]